MRLYRDGSKSGFEAKAVPAGRQSFSSQLPEKECHGLYLAIRLCKRRDQFKQAHAEYIYTYIYVTHVKAAKALLALHSFQT